MKKLLVLLCLSASILSAVPAYASANQEKAMHERARVNAIKSIKTFAPYSYKELNRLQSVVDKLKLEDPDNIEAIQAAEELVKKQKAFIAAREQKLIELEKKGDS